MSLAGPSYMALVFDLVGHRDLANAIALNSTQFQLARVLGPVAAGVGFKLFGLAGCFIANAVSFVFVVGAMLMVKFNQPGARDAASTDDTHDQTAVRMSMWQPDPQCGKWRPDPA